MNKVIDHLNQLIRGESDRISSRVAELQQSNIADHELLDSYVERFTLAVQDEAGEEEIARLEKQRNEALKRVEQNEEIIRILTTTNGSKVQRLKADLVGEHFKAMKEIEDEATILYNELKSIHDQLVKGASQLKELNKRHIDHMKQIDRNYLNREDQIRYNIAGSRECDPQQNIANDMARRKVLTMLRNMEFKPFANLK